MVMEVLPTAALPQRTSFTAFFVAIGLVSTLMFLFYVSAFDLPCPQPIKIIITSSNSLSNTQKSSD
jgi:hypothetical protein